MNSKQIQILLKYCFLAFLAIICLTQMPKACAIDSNQLEKVKAATSKNPNRAVKDKWALIVGVSEFENPKYNLKYASKDARDFATALIEKLDFEPDHIKLLIDDQATKKNIMSLLGDTWLPRVARPDDVVVVYFSTHGSPASIDVGKMNFLMAYDSNIKELFATGVSMQNLSSVIKQRVHSDRVVLILDSCHSGAVSPNSGQAKGLTRTFNVDANALAQGTGQLVITSSLPSERSWESNRYKSSVFTKHLIDGLKRNGDSTKLGEAFKYTQSQVQQEVQRDRGVLQTPVLKSKWEGNDLLLAAKPEDPAPGVKIEVGNIKIIVIPEAYADNDADDSDTAANVEKKKLTVKITPLGKQSDSESKTEKTTVKETKTEAKKSTVILDKLPPKFRIRSKSKNHVIAAKYNNSAIFEWDEKKLFYKVKWDSGKKGIAHIEKLANNHVVIKESTRLFWGKTHNTYEGNIVNNGNRIEGTMGGHDSWTRWSGTWEAWW